MRDQRQQVILEEVSRAGSVSVAELSGRFRVSDMTVRRDLEALSARKLLKKVHGGAVRMPKTAAEPHFAQKQRLSLPEKKAVARVAAGFVEDGMTVAFSAGTTTWHVAAALRREVGELTFITNSD